MPIGNVRNRILVPLAHTVVMLLLAISLRVLQYSWKAGSARILDVVRLKMPVALGAPAGEPIC